MVNYPVIFESVCTKSPFYVGFPERLWVLLQAPTQRLKKDWLCSLETLDGEFGPLYVPWLNHVLHSKSVNVCDNDLLSTLYVYQFISLCMFMFMLRVDDKSSIKFHRDLHTHCVWIPSMSQDR